MACIDCGAGMHFACREFQTRKEHPCCCSNSPVDEVEDEKDEPRYVSRTYKREGTLKDQQSTGRKRAAKLYPLDFEASCEWQGLAKAGGGNYPIVGCESGTQQARHHGPDKNTLNNDKGNVHRICHKCHNRWHTKNDLDYVAGEVTNKHNTVLLATVQELMESELYWVGKKTIKAKD